MKIVRGIEQSPVKLVLYGTEGIGKTTLASQFPNPVILDTEEGSRRIDCARVNCTTWATLEDAMVELGGNAQGFQTVVIDSVDWAEALLKEHLHRKLGKPVDDLPFGRGYGVVAEAFSKLLTHADVLVARGLHVVLVGHSAVKRCTPPDMDEGFDRFELKLSKQVGPLVKEWADAILFANYQTRVVEGADGKRRGRGGRDRVLYAERSAAYDAKNRFGLAAQIEMTIEALAPLFVEQQLAVTIARHIEDATAERTLSRIYGRIGVLFGEGKLTNREHGELSDLVAAKRQQLDTQHDEREPREVADAVA